jgi:hypothetical protein
MKHAKKKKQDKTQTIDSSPSRQPSTLATKSYLTITNKSQMTADFKPTTVKLHLLKKTTAMNIKLNIGKNKRDSEERERERE